MTVRDWLNDNGEKFQVRTDLVHACVEALGVDRSGVSKILRSIEVKTGVRLPDRPGAPRPACALRAPSEHPDHPVSDPALVRTLGKFRQENDVTVKIRAGIARLLTVDSKNFDASPTFTDNEFRDKCGVHVNNWRRNADLDEFKKYQLTVRRVLYWADPSVIEEMQKITGVYK
jgi:hypothetical protein